MQSEKLEFDDRLTPDNDGSEMWEMQLIRDKLYFMCASDFCSNSDVCKYRTQVFSVSTTCRPIMRGAIEIF